MSKYVLITKDALCLDYLPIYGNLYWKTPNIDALAKKGTVFKNHYTAAPSTVMSFYSMITGKYGHETKYEMYEKIHDVYNGETLFSKLKKQGYDCHIIWDEMWDVLPEYFDCYRDDVEIHTLKKFRQGVGAHYIHDGFLKPDAEKEAYAFDMVERAIGDVLNSSENVFLWIHFPHVIYGKVAYGSDMELFDRYIGAIRKIVTDDCIAISADHGNMNGHKGKTGYGFDVYEPAIKIPLITPKIGNEDICTINTSSVDLYAILFDKTIPNREFVYSDSAYCAQKHRKIAILKDKYKYIYNKQTSTEELYDLQFDPTEEFSVMEDYVYDTDRKINAPSREYYFYNKWECLTSIRKIMRGEKERIWREGSKKVVLKSNLKDILRPLYDQLTKTKMK